MVDVSGARAVTVEIPLPKYEEMIRKAYAFDILAEAISNKNDYSDISDIKKLFHFERKDKIADEKQ